MAPAALSLISVTFTEPKERAKAFGVFGAVSGGGAAIGMILGGALTEYASWRWCWASTCRSPWLTALARVRVRQGEQGARQHQVRHPRCDPRDLGLVALVYGFTQAAKLKDPGKSTEVLGWTDSSTITFLAPAWCCWWPSWCGSSASKHTAAADEGRTRSQPRRFLPGVPVHRRGHVRHVPVPDVLLPDHDGLHARSRVAFAFLPFSIGVIVTAGVVANLLPRIGPEADHGPRSGAGHPRHADADPDHRRHALLGMRHAVAPVDEHRHGCVFITASSTALVGSARTTPVSRARCSTPRNRSVGLSAPRCSTRCTPGRSRAISRITWGSRREPRPAMRSSTAITSRSSGAR